jgi:predicted porin
MKKSLLALAVMGAFAGSAFAQASSVTIFGKLDQAIGKNVGTKNKEVLDTAGSRIAFRGYEDLGGGLGAIFAIEHRFAPDTGNFGGGAAPVASTGTRFWEGFSFLGLRTTFGTITIGRQYTSSFLGVQNQIDPFAGETVAKLRDIGTGLQAGGFGLNNIGQGFQATPGQVRVENSVKYAHNFGPVSVSADVAEKGNGTMVGAVDRPYSVAVGYTGGPLWVGVSWEDPQGANDELLNIGARFKLGAATLSGGIADGKTNAATNNKVKAYLLGVNVAVGSGDIKAGYTTLKVANVTRSQRFGVGYHHNLSKRTKLFADFVRDNKSITPAGSPEKSGYDFGVQHNF